MRRFFLLFATVVGCSAATVVTNSDLSGQIWTSNGSPYIVDRDVYGLGIFHDEFVIGPGVEVLVASTDASSSGVDSNRVEFRLYGRTRLLGTPAQPIVFRSLSDDVASSWYGLYVVGGTGSGFVAFNVVISHAVHGIHFWYARGYYMNVDRVTVATNSVGIRMDGGGALLSRILSFNNSTGIFLFGDGSTVDQSIIRDNAWDGLVVGAPDYREQDSRWHARFNTIHRNGGAGLRIIGNYWQILEVTVESCLISSNQFGIMHEFGQFERERDFRIRFCDVTGNTVSNYVRTAPGAGCISVEPRLLSNLQLSRHSPCIDAGAWTFYATDFAGQPRTVDDPATRNTGEVGYYGDVSVSDIGAFEYQPRRVRRQSAESDASQ
jgi:hypothetical protein